VGQKKLSFKIICSLVEMIRRMGLIAALSLFAAGTALFCANDRRNSKQLFGSISPR
jgi:hypothetical protein